MNKIIKLTEADLKRIVKKVILKEDLGGMISDPRIIAKEYGETPESPETKAAEQIFQLFDHKIGEWSISPNHRVTQETNKYLADWKENIISRLEVIINTVVSEYQEQDIDDELELGENNRTLAGGDETKGGLPKQRGSKHPAMKLKIT